jgi:hypothetical protein
MPDTPYSTRFSFGDGRIELEGSEAFVDKQLALLQPLLEILLRGDAPSRISRPSGSANVETNQNDGKVPAGIDGFQNLFVSSENGVQILKDLPGITKAPKTVNAALLLTLANTLTGAETTTFDDIRAMCKTHGCLDSANFAKTIKAEKDAFIFGGTARKQTVKLTVPGRKRADALAETLK